MAQVTTPQETRMMVAASTIHPPHCRCGTKSKMSTKNASKDTSSVGRSRISKARRKRGECDGLWKWAAAARQRQTRVRKAATGCTIRIDESDLRALDGRLKSLLLLLIPAADELSYRTHSRQRDEGPGREGKTHCWYTRHGWGCRYPLGNSRRRRSRHC